MADQQAKTSLSLEPTFFKIPFSEFKPFINKYVTHLYLLLVEEQPQCFGCYAPFTVRHILLECGDFQQVSNNCFHVINMKHLFQYILLDFSLTVKAATFIFISRCGSAISSAKEGKSGFIYNLVKSK